MCCQEPFDISACQLRFNILRGIDTLLTIWWDKPSVGKILLTLRVNLWFSAPRLVLYFPVGFPCLRIVCGRTLQCRCLSAVLLTHKCFSLVSEPETFRLNYIP